MFFVQDLADKTGLHSVWRAPSGPRRSSPLEDLRNLSGLGSSVQEKSSSLAASTAIKVSHGEWDWEMFFVQDLADKTGLQTKQSAVWWAPLGPGTIPLPKGLDQLVFPKSSVGKVQPYLQFSIHLKCCEKEFRGWPRGNSLSQDFADPQAGTTGIQHSSQLKEAAVWPLLKDAFSQDSSIMLC